jgi:(4S)-4-hydroxy-5-phosphonooxypentane-2,3-dione isomerase
MLVVHVDVLVKADCVEAFKAATVENGSNSVKEAGIARFDVVQDTADPCHFVLVEAYKTEDAPAKHKETAHYFKWRDAVAPMMARPRTSVKYANIFPSDESW